jgi:hypothetical protein
VKEIIAACQSDPEIKQFVQEMRAAGYSVIDIAGALKMSVVQRYKIRQMLKRMRAEGLRSAAPVETDARRRQLLRGHGDRIRDIELALCKPWGGWPETAS